MRLVRVTKKVGEIRPVLLDWADILPETTDTAIVASSWALESGDVTIEPDPTFTATATFCKVSSGTADQPWLLVNSVRTSLGNLLVCRVRGFTEVGTSSGVLQTVYYGVGVADRTDVTGLEELESIGSLGFNVNYTTLADQKAYFAYPASWGAASVWVDGMIQTQAFRALQIQVGGVDYLLYESTDLLTTTNLTVEVKS